MLGQWQWSKAETKTALAERYGQAGRLSTLNWAEAMALGDAALYRRVRLQGSFAAEFRILLDNRVSHGRAGYHAVVPMRLDPGGAVLVNLGWLPTGDRRQLPEIVPPTGTQTVEGLLVPARARYLELADAGGAGRLWQNLDLARYRVWFGAELPDRLLLRTDSAADGLVRDWPAPDAGVAKHRAYAGQWFSLSGLSVGLWLYFAVLKR